MTPYEKARTLVTGGWLLWLVPLAGALVLRGSDELVPVLVGFTVVAGMVGWTRSRSGRPAYVVSAVLGVLLGLQSVGYLAADLADGADAVYPVLDGISLAVGVAIVFGSVWALRTRGRSPLAATA